MRENHTHWHWQPLPPPTQRPLTDPKRHTAAWELHNSKQEGHKGDRKTTAAAAHTTKGTQHTAHARLYVWQQPCLNRLLLSLQCWCCCVSDVGPRGDC